MALPLVRTFRLPAIRSPEGEDVPLPPRHYNLHDVSYTASISNGWHLVGNMGIRKYCFIMADM